jgi:hypothetical protein
MLWAYIWAAILGGVLLSVVVEQTTGYAPWGWGAVGAVLGVVAVAAFHALYLQLRRTGELRPGVTPSLGPRPVPTAPVGDLHTDYGTLLHCGDVVVTLERDGRLSLTTWSRPELQDQGVAEVVRVVACLSLWINVLGQAARGEAGVPLGVLLDDLDRTTEEVIAAPRWENLQVTYLAGLPPAGQSVSASASIHMSPQTDMIAHWKDLNTGPTDATTFRRVACAMLEAVIEELATVQGCQMVTAGCAAVTAGVRHDPSWLANQVSEAVLLGNVYRFAEQNSGSA